MLILRTLGRQLRLYRRGTKTFCCLCRTTLPVHPMSMVASDQASGIFRLLAKTISVLTLGHDIRYQRPKGPTLTC